MALAAKQFGWSYEQMMNTPAAFFNRASMLVQAFEKGQQENAKHRANVSKAKARNARALR